MKINLIGKKLKIDYTSKETDPREIEGKVEVFFCCTKEEKLLISGVGYNDILLDINEVKGAIFLTKKHPNNDITIKPENLKIKKIPTKPKRTGITKEK